VEGWSAARNLRIDGLTRSCHQCHGQHVFRQCQCVVPGCACRSPQPKASKSAAPPAPLEPVCSQSICRNCLEKHYFPAVGVTWCDDSAAIICPRCRGCCNCRTHLRAESHDAVKPAFTLEQLAAASQLCLAYVAPAVTGLLSEWTAEAAHDGVTSLLEVRGLWG